VQLVGDPADAIAFCVGSILLGDRLAAANWSR
jgi:hypothetical protein